MSKSTDNGRLVTAIVVLVVVSFGLLSLVQHTRPLSGLGHSHSSLAKARLHFTRNAIEEVSPTGPRLPTLAWPIVRSGAELGANRIPQRPAMLAAATWFALGHVQHRRIPATSADDPALL